MSRLYHLHKLLHLLSRITFKRKLLFLKLQYIVNRSWQQKVVYNLGVDMYDDTIFQCQEECSSYYCKKISGTASIYETNPGDILPTLKMLIEDATEYRRNTARGIGNVNCYGAASEAQQARRKTMTTVNTELIPSISGVTCGEGERLLLLNRKSSVSVKEMVADCFPAFLEKRHIPYQLTVYMPALSCQGSNK